MFPFVKNAHGKESAIQSPAGFWAWVAEQFCSFLFAYLHFLMFYIVDMYRVSNKQSFI